MKRVLIAVLVGLSFVTAGRVVPLLFAAQSRVIPSPDRLQAVTVVFTKDMNGTDVAVSFRASFVSIIAPPSGEITTIPSDSIEVDLLKSNGMVTVGGEVYYDKEAADILAAIALREYAKANPTALPQRRRALRQP